MNNYDVIIIGAGAAGMMCAIAAGQRGRKVLLLDHTDQIGKKVLISGGGRCNFTNLLIEPENYLSNNPHFCKSALSRFSQYDFIDFVEKHGVSYYEKISGQLFCNGKSAEIVNILLKECHTVGISIQTKCAIEKINKENDFTISTNLGDYFAESLVIATGGLSMPKIGATGFGFTVAKQFGIKVIACQPGLVPLTFSDELLKGLIDLSGISVDASVSCNGQTFRGFILFTHKGLSGPAILQISNYWQLGDEIIINLLPDIDLEKTIKNWQKERPKSELKKQIGYLLTQRLARIFLRSSYYDKPVKQYDEKEIIVIASIFHQWRISPSGTEGYRKAEVTKGGIDTNELSSKTFETRKVKGLYFVGEVIDVTGWLGGFNLQWAWSSGYCAGHYV